MTPAEVRLWSRQRHEAPGYRFRRQLPVGPFVVDFGCLESRLAVEVDGATYSTDEERAYDARRSHYLDRLGRRVLRVWNDEVFRNLGGVLEAIWRLGT